MIFSIADFFGADRSTRPLRQGLASNRAHAIMVNQGNLSIDRPLLRRFVSLMRLREVGHLVRLNTDELAVIMGKHRSEPLRPQVTIITDRQGECIERRQGVSMWERDGRGGYPRLVVDAVDPDAIGIDPLT